MATVKGTAKECFDHLLAEIGRAALGAEIRKEFGIGKGTSNYWLRGDNFPKGRNRLKLMHFLQKRGYTLTEFDNMDPLILQWGKGVAEGKVSLEESAREAGYSNPMHAFGPLFGQHGMDEELTERLRNFLADRRLLKEEAEPESERDKKIATEPQPSSTSKAGVTRQIVDHATNIFNSFANLVESVELHQADINESDRMQIAGATRKILQKMGVEILIPQFDESRFEPLAPESISALGLRKPRNQRRRQ